jgi:Fe2+ transport system protein FeoA
LILKALGQEENDEMYMVLMGPLNKKQLAEMGMVKDSSITKK